MVSPTDSQTYSPPRATVRILKSIPKASRSQAGRKMATILEAIVRKNDHASWDSFFRFSSRCLRAPKRGSRRYSLATVVNRQLDVEADSSVISPVHRSRQRQSSTHDPMKSLAIRVSTKLEEGDFKGAVRLASSDVKLARMNMATFEALKEKHPPLHPDSAFPPLPEDLQSDSVSVTDEDIIKAIQMVLLEVLMA